MIKTVVVPVPGIGDFEVKRRNMRAAIAITAEYSRLVEGQTEVPDNFASICNMVAYVKVMVVAAPPGWDVDEMDPDSEADIEKLKEVFGALLATEARFRGTGGKNGTGAGADAQPVAGVVVQEPVSAGTD